ncbi:MAG: MFS transporter [Clostridia bacterium]|nr:MFS transporter [Clostridia bacterium]
MKKITDKKQILLLTSMCIAAYLVSYLTRKNFNAVLAEFVVAEGVEKSAASIITVSLFIFYGVGQLLSGWLGDKLSPRKIMTFGLLLTTAVNFIMPFLGSNTALMAVFWGINGIAQAFMWPPMVKIMTSRFHADEYKKAVVRVSIGSAVGTMLIYGIAALFIKVFGQWRTVFYFASACGLVMAFLWEFGVRRIEENAEKYGEEIASPVGIDTKKNGKTEKVSGFNPFTMSPIIIIMIAIVLQGMLRDGVESWMPSYLSESYGIETSGAILSSIILPILTIVCMKVTSWVYNRFFTNELTCSAVIFAVGTAASLVLFFLHGTSAPVAITLVALVSSAMHGVNLILIGMIPQKYEKYGNVSFIAGLINFCTYIGSAIFTYGIAKIAEVWDWRVTIFSWFVIALVGTVLCAVIIGAWKRFKDNA